MIHSIEQLFPLLITFLVGGACGAVVMGPRIAWKRAAAPQLRDDPQPAVTADRSDLLMVSPKVDQAVGLTGLHAAALDEAARVYGPAAQLDVVRSGPLLITSGSRLLQADVLVRCLNYQEVMAYGA